MNDMAQGMSQSPDTTPSIPVSESAPQSAPTERTFRQSEVTDIVKRERNEAVEKYRRLQSEQPQYVAQKYGDVSPQSQQAPVNTGNSFNESQFRQMAAEEAQRLRDQWIGEANAKNQEEQAKQIVNTFWQKVQTGKDKYTDFDKVTGDVNYRAFPNVVQLLAQYIDNAGDVMYELGKDRIKLSNLEQLANLSPQDAIVQAQRLAESLKANEQGSKVRIPNEPLNQLRPSNTGMDNGAMSVGDYRKKYRV